MNTCLPVPLLYFSKMDNLKISALYVYDIFAFILWHYDIIIDEVKDWGYQPRQNISKVQQEIGEIIVTYQVLTRNLFRRHFARHSSWVLCSADEACRAMLEDLGGVGLTLLDGFDRTFCGAALVMELYLYLWNERLHYLVSPSDLFGDLLREAITQPLRGELLDPNGNFKMYLNDRLAMLSALFTRITPLTMNLTRPYDAFDPQFLSEKGFPIYHDLQRNLARALYLTPDPDEEKPRPVPFRWERSSTQ